MASSSPPLETPTAWLVADYATQEQRLATGTMRACLAWDEARGTPLIGKQGFKRPDGVLEADFGFSFETGTELLELDAPAVENYFVEIGLDEASAKGLQREPYELLGRYERRDQVLSLALRASIARVKAAGDEADWRRSPPKLAHAIPSVVSFPTQPPSFILFLQCFAFVGW